MPQASDDKKMAFNRYMPTLRIELVRAISNYYMCKAYIEFGLIKIDMELPFME